MRKEQVDKQFSEFYIKNFYRIILIVSICISLAVIITGFTGYGNTKKLIINKAKSKDIVFMVESMGNKIDGRIKRALETSYVFANDPSNIEWVDGEEKDAILGKKVLMNAHNIVENFDYNMFFLTGFKTKHDYFFNKSSDHAKERIFSEATPADKWFFDWEKEKKQVDLNVNYDDVTKDTLLFVNTRIGNANNPVGICGVGLSLGDISEEFRECKIGQKSNLWTIDDKGIIKLSDSRSDIGSNYSKFLPKEIISQIRSKTSKDITISQYENSNHEIIDYAYYKLSSCNWTLFYQVPRYESLSIIHSLKINMIITVFLVLLSFAFLLYIAFTKIVNPYEQIILINEELEHEIGVRTQELQHANEKIIDSIQYAKKLQESILPSQEEIKKLFLENFVLWKPKDIVGGDFFWLKEIENVIVFAVGDCTGHGVPGALMTMTVNAILHNIVTIVNKEDPSLILKELHVRLKETLNKSSNSQSVDDGLDIAVMCVKNKSELTYAGANIGLYIKNREKVKFLDAQCRGIGYNFIKINEFIQNYMVHIEQGDSFIAVTDGFIHQNGGNGNYPFGKQRLFNMIERSKAANLNVMKDEFACELEQYMCGKDQRDDITIVGFKVM